MPLNGCAHRDAPSLIKNLKLHASCVVPEVEGDIRLPLFDRIKNCGAIAHRISGQRLGKHDVRTNGLESKLKGKKDFWNPKDMFAGPMVIHFADRHHMPA